MSESWEFRARLERVVDGDTVDLDVDLGFRVSKKVRVRLQDVDTAEIYGVSKDSDEYELGMEQKRFVEDFLDAEGDWPLRFISREEAGKYGRWLGDIEVEGELLTARLIEEWPDCYSE